MSGDIMPAAKSLLTVLIFSSAIFFLGLSKLSVAASSMHVKSSWWWRGSSFERD